MEKNDSEKVKKVGQTTGGKEPTKKSYPRGSHPNSLSNLQKWPRGVSGNPLGPPKRQKILQDAFKAKLEEIVQENGPDKGKKIVEAVADMAWEMLKKCKTPSEFSSILSQIRETAGERALLETEQTTQTHFYELDLTELLEQAGKVLDRHRTAEIPSKVSENAEIAQFEEIKKEDNESNNKDMSQ